MSGESSFDKNQIEKLAETTEEISSSLDETIPLAKTLEHVPKLNEKLDTLLQSNDDSSLLPEFKKLGTLPINPGEGDPFASFLMGFSGYKVVWVVLVTLLIGISPYLVALYEGNFRNPSLDPDAMRDIGLFCISILAMPTIVVLFGLYFGRLSRTILQLISSNAFSASKEQYNEFKKTVDQIYKNKVIVFAPYAIAFFVTVFVSVFYHFGDKESWHSLSFTQHRTLAGWLHIPLTFLVYFLISLAVFRLIGTFLALRVFFRFSANIQPLHPDSCGGLSPLGRLSMRLNYATFLFGLISVGGIFTNTFNYKLPFFCVWNIAIICGYVFGVVGAFFLPLYAAHRRMREAKYRTIQIINSRFNEINRDLLRELEDSKKVSNSKISQMDSLRKVHEIASKMPVYPFNIRTVTSFLGSLLTPMTILFLQKIIAALLFSGNT